MFQTWLFQSRNLHFYPSHFDCLSYFNFSVFLSFPLSFHISFFSVFFPSHFDCLSHFNYFRFFNINLSYIDPFVRNLLQKLQFKMRNIGVLCRIIGIVTVAFVLKYCGTAPHIGDCGYISASINIEVKNFEARYI